MNPVFKKIINFWNNPLKNGSAEETGNVTFNKTINDQGEYFGGAKLPILTFLSMTEIEVGRGT